MKLSELAEQLNLIPQAIHKAVKPRANTVVVSQKGEGATYGLRETFPQ
jgi:hypothetical protein